MEPSALVLLNTPTNNPKQLPLKTHTAAKTPGSYCRMLRAVWYVRIGIN